MVLKNNLSEGDFTGLATDYSQHRPDYCPSVLNGLIGLLDRPFDEIDFVDVGAGTGIWTRMVYNKGCRSVTAIEPNDDMRSKGIADSNDYSISWLPGTAEQTDLPTSSCNWVTMASSFHWANYNDAIKEFWRILKPGGRFSALWNPRLIEVNPLLIKIESYLDTLAPKLERVSSGRSGITKTLTKKLWESPFFEDIVYLEGRHIIQMNPERYMGVWRSVNDLQVQLGEAKFNTFLNFIEQEIDGLDFIEATYLTRAWSARRKD